jgi:hypothetical protein
MAAQPLASQVVLRSIEIVNLALVEFKMKLLSDLGADTRWQIDRLERHVKNSFYSV